MSDQKSHPSDSGREPDELPEAELEKVSGGVKPAKPLNPQPLPPISY